MTYQNDPNLPRRNMVRDTDETSYTGWIIGGIVALAVIIAIFAFARNDQSTTASNTTANPPASSTTAPSTTGAGSAPTRPAPAPAPAPSPSGR